MAGVALALALGTAVGIGLVRSDRQQPIITHWAGPGEVVAVRGMEFEFVSLEAVDYEPQGSSDPVPAGAVALVAEFRQRILEVPEERFDLSCDIRLENGPDSWSRDFDVGYDLELSPECHPAEDERVTPGGERTVSLAWVVPETAVDGARLAIRFYAGDPEGIGFDPAG